MSASQEKPKISNARDLVERILGHPQGGIEALLKLAEDQETDWLEFKAALHPEGGVFQPRENADDYCWHVARAAVALANTAGGAVILGLDDNLQPVGLAASDPEGTLEIKGRETFNRDILYPAVTGGHWKTGRCGTLRLQGRLTSLVDIHNADYHGHPLAVILVAPMPDEDLLEVSELRNNRERLIIPVRVPGAVGQVRDVHGRKETRDYERARETQLRSHRYEQIWERFITSLPTEVPATPADLIDTSVEQVLVAYSSECVKSWRSLNDLFTPLDLEERDTGEIPAHDHEFVPEAEEWRDLFATDDPWDTDDLDGDDDDDQDQVEDDAQEQMPEPLRKGSVFDLLAQEPRAILLGEPGAGKSTCLQRLALRQAEAYQQGATVALYVPLRGFTDQGLKALIERLGRQPWQIIEALIQTKRLHLLLDAVNECPRHLQERCCQDIKALLDTYPDLPVLVTARNLSYRCQLLLPTFIVRPLDAGQQQRFLTAYLRGDTARASALLAQIQNQPGGALIASNPLLLRIVVEVSRGQGELPQGRALLYRRFFEDWYRREENKESRTGAALRWTFPRTLEALSSLALAARQGGHIEMARIWSEHTLRPLLADDTVPFLERMAQGLLLELDAEQQSLRFSHETVQEYLAAEALIRQPNVLAEVPEGASTSWRMPLAYAFELASDPPESLVREAWQRDPLLVAVALRDDELLSALPIAEDADPWLTGVLRTLRGEPCEIESECITQDLLYPPVHPLPDAVASALASQAVWYAGLAHHSGNIRLERLRRLITQREEPWLDLLPIVCDHHPQWKEKLDGSQLALIAFEQTQDKHRKKALAQQLNLQCVSFLKRHKAVSENALKWHRKELIAQATPKQLLLIASAVWVEDIPADKMQDIVQLIREPYWDWLIHSTFLIGNNFSRGAAIPKWKIKEWIRRSDPVQIGILLKSELIDHHDIPEAKRQQLIENMDAGQAGSLINAGIIQREEITEPKRQQLIENMDAGQAGSLMITGIIQREEIPEAKRQQWIENMDAGQAQWLISNRVIQREEIPEAKRQQLIEYMDAGQAGSLMITGIIQREEIPEAKRQQWIENMDVGQAQWLISNRVIQREEIPEAKRQQWIENMDAGQAQWLISNRVIQREEIPEAKRQQWIENINAGSEFSSGQLPYLAQVGFLTRDDLREDTIQKIITEMGPGRAVWLIRTGILSCIDINKKKRTDLMRRMDANEAVELISLGLYNLDEIPDDIRQQIIDKKICTDNMDPATSNRHRIVYTKEEIQDIQHRIVAELKLKGSFWKMIVVHINPDGMSGFASQPNFDWNLFFLKQRLVLEQNAPLKKGDILQAEVAIVFNKKREEWNFAIKQGSRTECAPYDIPDWWQAWQFFAPRWEMAAEGQYFLQPELFNKLQSEGFDTECLRSWDPTDKDGRRVKLANRLVQIALNEPADSLPQRKTHISQQLAGDGVWADLRKLAEAYLDGKQVFSHLHKEPIEKQHRLNNNSSVLPNPVATGTKKPSVKRSSTVSGGNRDSALPSFDTSFNQFTNETASFTMYIDETWATGDAVLQNNEGVIAGVICRGEPGKVFDELPKISTHSSDDFSVSRAAIKNLLACTKCRPFILPIRMMREEQCAQQYYDLMLQHAIRLICGWLMQPKKKTRISIFCERIYQHTEGKDGTDFIKGGWLVAQERFQNWNLVKVRWEKKDFGYLPYADLLAYMSRGSTKANRLGALANYKQLPGYVPFSLELVPRLERLEHLENSANFDDVIEFALETGDSPFGRVVMRDIAKRLSARLDLQQRLLETLEARYRDKARDLKPLRLAFAAVRQLLPALPENATPKMRLLWYLLALQDANHDGDPQRIRDTAGAYLQEREQLKKSDRELCADADLNLAVHYADHFAFGHAEVTVGDWIYDPLFTALSDRQQGRFYSALGQYRAMQGDAEGADSFFAKALKLFAEAPLTEDERKKECDQTSIYRAINAIDGSLRVAPQALEVVFGAITPALAEQFAADGSVESHFRHHLLLRALVQRPELSETREAYLAARDQWQPGHTQHPWPSIHGHRGFLLWNYGDLDDPKTDKIAGAAFEQAIDLAGQVHHGLTMKLIGGLWATVAACCYDDGYEDDARNLLKQVRILPEAETIITALEDVLTAPDPERIDEVFAAVPFNYR